MPATEQTWRDQRLLHRIFGATGFVLLAATILMFYVDHDREWKQYQDTSRHVELTYNEWLQLQHRSDEAVRKHERLREDLLVAESTDAAPELLADFEKTANRDELTKILWERQKIGERAKALTAAVDAVVEAKDEEAKQAARLKAAGIRTDLVKRLNTVVTNVRFRETNKLDERKGKSGALDAAKANLDLAVRDSLPNQRDFQATIDKLKDELDKLIVEYETLADQRKRMQGLVKEITSAQDEVAKRAEANQTELKNLQTAYVDRSMNYFTDKFPYLGKKWLTLPVIDAFNSPRKIDNLWSEGLTLSNNFQQVRRFDRCTTCHQAMEKSLPGQADKGMFEDSRIITLSLPTPTFEAVQQAREEFKTTVHGSGTNEDDWLLLRLYGIRLASSGLESSDDVTVSLVTAGSIAASAEPSSGPAAKVRGEQLRNSLAYSASDDDRVGEKPGLALGDVIQQVAGNLTDRPEKVRRHLLTSAEFGKPLELVVRRGFTHPYSSHPRLDLFVGSMSPHNVATFACTVCHEGQGSATQFKWASHTPNSVRQGEEWARDHGWFDNGHWIFPMHSKRFTEATCLKCHHEVVELEASARFPEPPAPTLMHGYDLLRKYGCYGCHEINGYDGPTKRIGPDMRVEPNFFAASLQLKSLLGGDKGQSWNSLSADEQRWINQVAQHPEDDAARRRIVEILTDDAKQEEPRFSDDARKLAGVLKDVEAPGVMRKAGPSLRYTAHKLDDQFLFDWIQAPKHFRPTSRMPQFFGFRKHLADEHSQQMADDFEPVEILGMMTYLRSRSQEFAYLAKPQVQEPEAASDADRDSARVVRGKVMFETRGCLACHNHADFPDTDRYRAANEIVQGPNLSGLGSKFDPQRNKNGADWLYSWIKQPTRYHARTVMPDLFLDPIVSKNADGKVESITDPAADIVAYLLQSTNPDWKPDPDALRAGKGANLNRLVLENLKEAFFQETAAKYAETGIPESLKRELKRAEHELIVTNDRAGQALSDEQKLMYIGAKSIGKYGCSGCHDIPGFEDAKSIGTGLADWGRKDPAKLAFEHIAHYLDHHGTQHDGEHDKAAHDVDGDSGHEEIPDFYRQHVLSGHREGFIWQKLAEPRSYDFMKTENKRYNEWLRMPKFPFDGNERESLITFVLGLVAEPPTTKYLYKPDARSTALIEGRKVLDKFNCAGCHLLDAEKWRVGSTAEELAEQPAPNLYPFLSPHFTTDQIQSSLKTDSRGMHSTLLTGMPSIDDADARPRVSDEEGDAVDGSEEYDPANVKYPFDLWQPAVFAGRIYQAGVLPLNVPSNRIDRRYPANGGTLARYLLPSVTRAEKQLNPAAKGSESWAWVPPPLVGEGRKVQSQWLHDFMLNPYPIRPAVVLRMPRFNLTSAEATAVARYFAAVDNVAYPMEPIERRLPSYLAEKDEKYESTKAEGVESKNRLDDALKIVVNQNYCVKCHLVADFEPKGSDRAKAPNLARVHDRLRPGYLREWIANPKQLLPYSAMPINIPYVPADPKFGGGVDQKLFHGTSIEQVDGLVDLLMNFDNFSKAKNLIAPQVPKEAPKPDNATPTTDAKPSP